MARNLRTSLINGGFGRVPGVRAAITPFGSSPIGNIAAPDNPRLPTPIAPTPPRVVPPSPNIFSNAATAPPVPRPSVIPTGPQLPLNPQPFEFGNPFNEWFRDVQQGGEGQSAEAGEAEGSDDE